MLNAAELEALLNQLCIKNGFCLPSDELRRLSADPPQEVDAFANAVILAEGLNPEMLSKQTYRAVRETISAAFARSASSPNNSLKSDVAKPRALG